MGCEFAMGSLHRARAHLLNQGFGLAPVFDEICNGANLQSMLGSKYLQVRQAGHGAVVLHDLADHRGWRAARHGGKIAPGFCVASPHQHATVHRLQRENVARLHQVFRYGLLGHCGLHSACAVGCGDPGGDTFGRFDRHGEGRAFLVTIARCHGRQLQALAAFAGQRQTDQATAVAGHEVDAIGRYMVGCQYQITFVFAVFFVHENDDAPGAHVGNNVFNRGNGHGCRCCHSVVSHAGSRIWLSTLNW